MAGRAPLVPLDSSTSPPGCRVTTRCRLWCSASRIASYPCNTLRKVVIVENTSDEAAALHISSTRHPQPTAIRHDSGRDPERGAAGPYLDYRTVPIYKPIKSRLILI